MSKLPFPKNPQEIRELLEEIDEKLLHCTDKFINLQVKKPIEHLLEKRVQKYDLTSPQSEWFNIYSIYRSNQQLSEACNKLWATVELTNATKYSRVYRQVGEYFEPDFLQGTLIPTLYYSQISAFLSVLSSFGLLPIIIQRQRFFLVRTEDGWKLFQRKKYAKSFLKVKSHGWHEQMINTYDGIRKNDIGLPRLAIKKTHMLRKLRNSMHYAILGDLKMWRMSNGITMFLKYLPTAVRTIRVGIKNLAVIKKITTGCDKRFENLEASLKRVKMLT